MEHKNKETQEYGIAKIRKPIIRNKKIRKTRIYGTQ